MRFHLIGRLTPTYPPRENEGVDHDLGHCNSREDAEWVRRERFAAGGWASIEIIDSETSHEDTKHPGC